jgi:hypothetical protein
VQLRETKKGKIWHRDKDENRRNTKKKKKRQRREGFLIKGEVGKTKEPLLPCNRLRQGM